MFKSALDQSKNHSKLDSLHIYDSILTLKDQISQSWQEITYSGKLAKCSTAQNIIVAGMGGSALGGRIIQSLGQSILKAPLEVVTNYRLPFYADRKSLVILSSYSGDTEETVSCALDALARKCQIYVITSGGKLAHFASKYELPSYIFTPTANACNQPRMGLGYSITSQLALLSNCHFVNFGEPDLNSVLAHLLSMTENLRKEVATKFNPAKSLALKTKGKALIIISANHLTGTAHAIKNMVNENSKSFSVSFDLPELNHHLLEGLAFPLNLKNEVHFLIINSTLYPQVIRDRLDITKDLITKFRYPLTVIKPDGKDPVTQAFETLYFGEFLSYYLGIVNGLDPGPIPTIENFKIQLDKRHKRI